VNLKYEILDWDSHFFGFKIARSNNPIIESVSEINDLLKDANQENIKLIYFIVDEQNHAINEWLSSIDKPVTTNLTFKLNPNDVKSKSHVGVEVYNQTSIEKELFELAIQAGHDSRYKLDQRFRKGEFERLYQLWITNSVNHSIADYTFVYRANGLVKGFVTLKITGQTGTIGLIAVDESTRGLGIGKMLLSQVFQTLAELKAEQCLVATQKDNIGAVKFYESFGFSIFKSEVFYHIWL